MMSFERVANFFVRNLDLHDEFVLRYLSGAQKLHLYELLKENLSKDLGLLAPNISTGNYN